VEILNWFLVTQFLLTPHKAVFRTANQHATSNYAERETDNSMGTRGTVLAVIMGFLASISHYLDISIHRSQLKA
jgi:hypothetical protein